MHFQKQEPTDPSGGAKWTRRYSCAIASTADMLSVWTVFYQFIKQQDRLLVRLEDIEQRRGFTVRHYQGRNYETRGRTAAA